MRIKKYIDNIFNVFNILDYVIVFLLIFLSIKKGGFYKSDLLFIMSSFIGIGIIYVIKNVIYTIFYNEKTYIVDKFDLLIVLLGISYLFSIIFDTYINLNDTIFEALRYISIIFIYYIVKNSKNKEIFKNSIIIIAIILCILGIDQISLRLLDNFLTNIFSSGYLEKDYTRMSATIQYANTFAILILLGFILVLDKLENYLKIKENNDLSIYFILLTLFSSCIFLSSSRSVSLLLGVISVVSLIKIIKNINKNKFNSAKMIIHIACVLSVLMSLLLVLLVNRFILYKAYNVYLIYSIFLILLYYILTKLLNNISLENIIFKFKELIKVIKIKRKFKKVIVIVGIIGISVFVVFQIPMSLKLSSNNKKGVYKQNIYKLKKGELNTIYFKVIPKEADTRYELSLIEVDEDFNSHNIGSLNYYETTTNEFKVEYKATDKAKYILFSASCKKGSFEINNILINEKKYYLEHMFLPTEFVNRIISFINIDTSIRDRVYYLKDSVKMITKDYKTFLFGNGGEAFKHLYQEVRSFKYNSTEAHYSFIQIFIEAGIIAFISVVLIFIVSIKNSKNNYIKLALMILGLHSFIELNFSYYITICIFGILLGVLKTEDRLNLKINTVFYSMIVIIVGIFSEIVCLNATRAYYMRIPEVTEESSLKEVVKNVVKNEQRVMLDFSDTMYLNDLKESYELYLKFDLPESEQKNIQMNLKKVNKNQTKYYK